MAKPDKKGFRMKGMTLVLILVVATVAAGGLTIASVYLNGSSTKTASLIGVLTMYSAGNSASYNVTVVAKNGAGNMTLIPLKGSDLVSDHLFQVSNVLVSPYNVTMTVAGSNVSFGWIATTSQWTALNATYAGASGIAQSHIWNDLNSSYVAASGPDAVANTTIGEFSPAVFKLPSSYNMFIGVTIPVQPGYNIPFVVGPVMAAKAGGDEL